MVEVVVRPHSPISGSKIKRFLCCPTSFHKTPDDIPDTSPKTAAIEGEKAHDLAEQCLWEGESVLEKCGNKQMRDGARMYADYITSQVTSKWEVETERFLYMGDNFGFLDKDYIGGYYDALWYSPAQKTIHVFDYKFGFHVVEADTPQLTFYILAQILVYAREHHNESPWWREEIHDYLDRRYRNWTFKQTIVQPKRKDQQIHTYSLTLDKLHEFVDRMCDSVELYQDTMDFDQTTCNTNPLCKYCEKRLICDKAPTKSDDVGFKFDTK